MPPQSAPAARFTLLAWAALLAVLPARCAAQVAGDQRMQACLSGTNKYKNFRFRVSNQPTDKMFVGDLGFGPSVRIFCIEISEDPDQGVCGGASLPVMCRNNYDLPENCETLSEYTYGAEKQVVVGDREGNDAQWMLLWDPRDKPQMCYPRDVSVRIVYQIESTMGQSTVIAVVAIILVSVLVLAICAFGLSRLLGRVKRQREAKKRAAEGPYARAAALNAAGQDLAGIEYVACPNCRKCQGKPWRGENPLEEMKCASCGETNMGWVPVGASMVPEDPRYPQRGFSTVQISNRHDPAKEVALTLADIAPVPAEDVGVYPQCAYGYDEAAGAAYAVHGRPAGSFSGSTADPPPFFARAPATGSPNDAVFSNATLQS